MSSRKKNQNSLSDGKSEQPRSESQQKRARPVFGLDISTSCTGWCRIGDTLDQVNIGHISFKGHTLWEKADEAIATLKDQLVDVWPMTHDFFVEESLQGFRPGFSSASTLLTLAKFNGLLSFYMREATGKDPAYISSASARKQNGMKLLTKAKHPFALSHKEQVFENVVKILGECWPCKRGANESDPYVKRVVNHAFDEVDAYVIAVAGWRSLNS